jgi:hypothetical protein
MADDASEARGAVDDAVHDTWGGGMHDFTVDLGRALWSVDPQAFTEGHPELIELAEDALEGGRTLTIRSRPSMALSRGEVTIRAGEAHVVFACRWDRPAVQVSVLEGNVGGLFSAERRASMTRAIAEWYAAAGATDDGLGVVTIERTVPGTSVERLLWDIQGVAEELAAQEGALALRFEEFTDALVR